MVNQTNTRQSYSNSVAETYTETDWFDCELNGNYELPILHRRNEQHRKNFLERFGFGTYREMLECEKDGLR